MAEVLSGHDMLSQLIEFCTSYTGLFWLVFGSDIAIAVAYFAIPITMAVVLRDRKEDIPYPWLWILFVTFIVACGMTHVGHVWSAILGTQFLSFQAAVGVFTALASVGTAIAFALILPQIKLLPSPQQQKAQLEKLIAERTIEKDQLIREINHRVGNQLQIMRSLVSIESRRALGDECKDILERFKSELDTMAKEHLVRSRQDYLAVGLYAPDGTIVPVVASSDAADLFDARPLAKTI
jgi:hypothetical protein